MKKMNFWLLASLFMGAVAFTACSSSDDDNKGGGSNSSLIQPGTAVNPANMKMSALSGFVKDTWGDPLSGVTVTSGTESVRTDANGGFVLNKVNTKDGRSVVKFEKDGYVDIVRSAENQSGDIWEVVMLSEWDNNTVSTYASSDAMVGLGTQSGMNVNLQGGYKNAATNGEFTGYVNSKMTYLNPDDANFATMMPGGDLAAVRTDGSNAQLISYGMTKVDLTDYETGEKLQLADGKPATLTFPVPEKFKDNTPDEIPLWSFNEETGLWEEEGLATYDADNNVYVGTVTHFSWVNLDYPEVRVRLTIIVKDDKGNLLPGIKVDIDAQKNVTTNVKGQVSTYVPKNTEFYVTVHSADYANYPGEEVKEVIPAMDKDGSVTIILPTVAHISGKVINQGEGNNVATVWIDYDGRQTKKIHTDEDGQFFIIAPADYKGAAKLKVRGGDGSIKTADIELDGEDHAYTINYSSNLNAGGTGSVTLKGQTYKFTFGLVEVEDGGGVVIVGDQLSASTGYSNEAYENGWAMADLSIKNYSASKSTYGDDDILYMNMMTEGEGHTRAMFTENKKLTITKSGNNYRFQGSGKVQAEGGEFGWNDENVGEGKLDITMPLYARGEKRVNVTAANSPLPSWAPVIPDVAADYGIAILESPMFGKGGTLMYYSNSLGKAAYDALKAEVTKVMGEPTGSYDSEDYPWARFLKGEKYVYIAFSKYYTEENKPDLENMDVYMYNLDSGNNARISIFAYDGYKFSDKYQRKAPKVPFK
ncbi:MAG: carboxypeptidase regulatory-like domain-containing protein [Bacteroidaceae bacterium]|nr:carboxypeptidase regulatory-like domain-containing protein [Bacteroidaceae bacterium]